MKQLNTKQMNTDKHSNKLQEKLNTTDNSTSLIQYENVKDTPFTIASKQKENDESYEHFIMFGKYKISEAYENKEEALNEANTINWWKIMSVAHGIAEHINEVNNLKNN